jgi:hypothetical protein
MSVKTRTEAGNATGNAKLPNVLLREGKIEIWSRMSTASQLITEIACCSDDRRFPPVKLAVERSLYTRDYPVAEVIDRDNTTGQGNEVLDEMVNN